MFVSCLVTSRKAVCMKYFSDKFTISKCVLPFLKLLFANLVTFTPSHPGKILLYLKFTKSRTNTNQVPARDQNFSLTFSFFVWNVRLVSTRRQEATVEDWSLAISVSRVAGDPPRDSSGLKDLCGSSVILDRRIYLWYKYRE